MSEAKFILAEKIQKKNLSDKHKHRQWEQDQFLSHSTHSEFPLPATKFLRSMRGHLGWIIDLLMSVYPEPTLALSPCWFCLSLLNTALGLVLSVWNGNEPSYFWALLCICRRTYRPLLWFIRACTLFCTKRARYLRWNKRAFIYCRKGVRKPAL